MAGIVDCAQPSGTGGEYAKRVCDVAVALSGLAIAAPFTCLIALAIKIDSKGPIIFTQERLGMDHVPFKCLKFRTMCHGAAGPSWTQPDDSRVTRVGRVLRRLHLDELPQLVNVLRGEMSIVGPRPILESEAAHFDAPSVRFAVLPGITGLAQVTVGPEDHLEKFQLDAEYVGRWSLWLDLRIMLRTAGIILRVCGVRPRCADLPAPDRRER